MEDLPVVRAYRGKVAPAAVVEAVTTTAVATKLVAAVAA
jgi:hypothetical protein